MYAFNDRRSFEEGWGIFEDSDGRVVIMKLDDPSSVVPDLGYTVPKFKSDSAARRFVTRKANQGSKYHQQALTLLT